MLHRIASHLSGKVIVLHHNTVKAYVCNQDGTLSLFSSPDISAELNLSHFCVVVPVVVVVSIAVVVSILC